MQSTAFFMFKFLHRIRYVHIKSQSNPIALIRKYLPYLDLFDFPPAGIAEPAPAAHGWML